MQCNVNKLLKAVVYSSVHIGQVEIVECIYNVDNGCYRRRRR